MYKRILVLGVAVAAIAAAVIGTLEFQTGGLGTVKDWAGRTVVGIVNSFLVPDIDFATIDYSSPGTLKLGNVQLSAPDGTKIVTLGQMTLTLSEVPRYGEPLVIERVEMTDGRIVIHHDLKTGIIKGLNPIVKPSAGEDYQVKGSPQSFRLSETLKIRSLRLADISVEYHDGTNSPPLLLDHIVADMNLEPAEEASEPGWYAFDLRVDRGKLFNVTLPGRFNVDQFAAEFKEARVEVLVDQESRQTLPAQLSELISAYDARGHLNLSFSGRVEAPRSDSPKHDTGADTTQGLPPHHLNGTVGLSDFSLAIGEWRVPIEHLNAAFAAVNGSIDVSKLHAQLADGSLDVSAKVELAGDQPASMRWSAVGLVVERFFEAKNQHPPVTGKLTTTGRASTRLQDPTGTLSGDGNIRIRKGRLLEIPLIDSLASKVRKHIIGEHWPAADHKADVEFTLEPAGMRLSEFEVITDMIAARGKGLVAFDGKLDLTVNAGPLERVQSLIGEVGKIIGKLTDELVAYNVRGTFEKPVVSIRAPLGIGS